MVIEMVVHTDVIARRLIDFSITATQLKLNALLIRGHTKAAISGQI